MKSDYSGISVNTVRYPFRNAVGTSKWLILKLSYILTLSPAKKFQWSPRLWSGWHPLQRVLLYKVLHLHYCISILVPWIFDGKRSKVVIFSSFQFRDVCWIFSRHYYKNTTENINKQNFNLSYWAHNLMK